MKGPNLLLMRPIRNQAIAWEKTEAGAKLKIEHRSLWNRIAHRLFGSPLMTTLELDAPGALVWELCNGENTVNDIVKALAREFGPDVEPATDRTALYIFQLKQNNLIQYGGEA